MSPCSSSVSCHITECDGAKQWNFSSDCGANPEKHTHSQQTQIRMCAHVHFWPQFRMRRRQMATDEGGWAGYSMSSIHLDCVLNPK